MIYLIGNVETKTIKIGYSESNTYGRLDSCQTGNCSELKLLWTGEGDREYEQQLHSEFDIWKKRGEWFFCIKQNVRLWEEHFAYNFREWIEGISRKEVSKASRISQIVFLMEIMPDKTAAECSRIWYKNYERKEKSKISTYEMSEQELSKLFR